MPERALMKTEEKILFTFELNKKTEYFNLLVLSKPEILRLRIQETNCPKGHKVKVIKLFALEDKVCPEHHVQLDKSFQYSQIEVYSFVAQGKEDKVNIFIPTEKLSLAINIYNNINVKGFDVNVQTKNKGIFNRGVFIDDLRNIELYSEDDVNQKSMLSKQEVIELFGSDKPKLNMPEHQINAYKHALLLTCVSQLNCLVVGNPGTMKTEYAISLKELRGGAYVDSTNATDVGLIGMAVKGFDGGYSFAGGAIFEARGKLLLVDELDKMIVRNPAFLRHLNSITGNHLLDFRKGDIKYHDSEFYVSYIAFANPMHTRFQTIPKMEIEHTFKNNQESLSRMHFIFALNCKEPDHSKIKEYDMASLRIYLKQCRNIKITPKDITEDAKDEMQKLYKKNINDERFYKKLTDLVIAEAKFSLHSKVTLEDVKEVEKILEVQKEMLYTKAL